MLRTGLLAFLMIASVAFAGRTETMSGLAPDFAPGQEWSIKSAAPTTAKVVIARVEPWRETVAVHISIVDVPVPQGATGVGGTTVITHMPFDRSALAASVDRLLATGVAPPSGFEGGYKHWQDAKGGIFTVSVEKAIEFTFQAVGRR
jgi:hypothetical protein